MSITKRARVSFNLKMVLTAEDEAEIIKNMLDSTKRYMSMSKEERSKVPPRELYLMKLAATEGPEAAMGGIVTELVRKELRSLLVDDMDFTTVSPASVRWIS